MKYVVTGRNLCAVLEVNVGFSVGDSTSDKTLAPNVPLSTGIFYGRTGIVRVSIKAVELLVNTKTACGKVLKNNVLSFICLHNK